MGNVIFHGDSEIPNRVWNKEKDVHVFIDCFPSKKVESGFTVVLQREPPAIFPEFFKNLWFAQHTFDHCLTYSSFFANQNPNKFSVVQYGTTWIDSEKIKKNLKKEEMIGFVSGQKVFTEGHKLRSKFMDMVKDGLVPSQISFNAFSALFEKPQRNREIYERPMFSISIENSRFENYFTEKIMDAFLCRTIPVYWGCPNIGDFFDTRGIILAESLSELVWKSGTLSKELYEKMRPYVEKNYENALKFDCDRYWNYSNNCYYDRLVKKLETIF